MRLDNPRIIAKLHRLMEAGLARQKDPDGVKFRPVIELTPAGIAVMKAELPPPASLADLIPRRKSSFATDTGQVTQRVARVEGETGAPLDAAQTACFERLRLVRLNLARERQLPPYCICHDSTLKLIARFSPATLAALEQIKGMGPQRVKQYGEALLAAVTVTVEVVVLLVTAMLVLVGRVDLDARPGAGP